MGMVFKSAVGASRFAGCRRLPLTSTNVRLGPKERRSTVEVPDVPLEACAPWFANTCGKVFSSVSALVVP